MPANLSKGCGSTTRIKVVQSSSPPLWARKSSIKLVKINLSPKSFQLPRCPPCSLSDCTTLFRSFTTPQKQPFPISSKASQPNGPLMIFASMRFLQVTVWRFLYTVFFCGTLPHLAIVGPQIRRPNWRRLLYSWHRPDEEHGQIDLGVPGKVSPSGSVREGGFI